MNHFITLTWGLLAAVLLAATPLGQSQEAKTQPAPPSTLHVQREKGLDWLNQEPGPERLLGQ